MKSDIKPKKPTVIKCFRVSPTLDKRLAQLVKVKGYKDESEAIRAAITKDLDKAGL